MARNGICICLTLDYIRKWISERNSDSKKSQSALLLVYE